MYQVHYKVDTVHADLYPRHCDWCGADGQQAAWRWRLHQGDPDDHDGDEGNVKRDGYTVNKPHNYFSITIIRKTKRLSEHLRSTVASPCTTPSSMTRSEGVSRSTRWVPAVGFGVKIQNQEIK